MSKHPLFLIAAAIIISLGAGISLMVILTMERVVEPSLGTPTSAPLSNDEQFEHRERFFDGDPDRDVRGGQEMKPRW